MEKINDPSSLLALQGIAQDLVLVDSSWLIYKAFYGYGNLHAEVGGVRVHTGDIFGFMNAIINIASKMPRAAIVICLDHPDPWRHDVAATYKQNRDHDERGVKLKLREALQAASLLPNVYLAGGPRQEADDAIYSLARSYCDKYRYILIYANDNDLWQAITHNVRCFSQLTDKRRKLKRWTAKDQMEVELPFEMVGLDQVYEKYGCSPDQLAFKRAFRGDKSDNLAGISRLPETIIDVILRECNTPAEFVEWAKTVKTLSLKERLWVDVILCNIQVLDLNYTLMRLRKTHKVNVFKAPGSRDPLVKYQMQATLRKVDELVAMGHSDIIVTKKLGSS